MKCDHFYVYLVDLIAKNINRTCTSKAQRCKKKAEFVPFSLAAVPSCLCYNDFLSSAQTIVAQTLL